MKTVTILGATGSIGTQTLEVIRQHSDDFSVYALTAGRNIALLEKQIREFEPEFACLWKEEDAKELAQRIKGSSTTVVCGMEGLIQCAIADKVDFVVAAMVGMIGLRPVIEAIKEGKDIGLANKETLVCAGHIILPLAKEKGVTLLPIDSEHSAIFQCLQGLDGEKKQQLAGIYLTASGGPFRHKSKEELSSITLADALCHPNWSMGKKITIDSATMMNKGLEVIEAKWLFGLSFDQIKVLIQPQSIIHSMVEFVDGAVMAQLGTPDMKVPIQYALTYPKRVPLAGERLDFSKLSELVFEQPRKDILRGLEIAYTAGKIGGSMTTVMNAANEYAVAKFMKEEIAFMDIYRIIDEAMNRHSKIENPSLDEILEIENNIYQRLELETK